MSARKSISFETPNGIVGLTMLPGRVPMISDHTGAQLVALPAGMSWSTAERVARLVGPDVLRLKAEVSRIAYKNGYAQGQIDGVRATRKTIHDAAEIILQPVTDLLCASIGCAPKSATPS